MRAAARVRTANSVTRQSSRIGARTHAHVLCESGNWSTPERRRTAHGEVRAVDGSQLPFPSPLDTAPDEVDDMEAKHRSLGV